MVTSPDNAQPLCIILAQAPQNSAVNTQNSSAKTDHPKIDALKAPDSEASSPANKLSANNPPIKQDILNLRLLATEAWLANQNPSTVTIQLMGASDDAQIKNDLEILSQQIERDNIYVYRTKVNDLPFLTVLYGSFANRIEATQALQKLPVEIQKNRPQLRTIAGILQETK